MTGRVGRRRRWRPPGRVAAWRSGARAAAILAAAGALAGCASGVPDTPSTPGPADPASGSREVVEAPPARASYTAAQAERGEGVFSNVCSACHGRSEFSGPIFAMTWMAEPLGHLFEHVSTTMPQDRPGSLSGEDYAAVLAYFLRVNGREAGDTELPADPELLGRIRW